jgi:hypothetical protein
MRTGQVAKRQSRRVSIVGVSLHMQELSEGSHCYTDECNVRVDTLRTCILLFQANVRNSSFDLQMMRILTALGTEERRQVSKHLGTVLATWSVGW